MISNELNFAHKLHGIQPSDFIHLKGKIFGEYNFIYHINDGYNPKDLSSFHAKHQLLFQKISDRTAQTNLMIVDSVFPIILADIVLEVFLKKVRHFRNT